MFAADSSVPVLSGQWFDLIHVSALVLLAMSMLGSLGIVCHSLCYNRDLIVSSLSHRLPFLSAVLDLLFSFSHAADHSFIFFRQVPIPDELCIAMGTNLNVMGSMQSSITWITALNIYMVICRKQAVLSFGTRDWKLVLLVVLFPTCTATVGLCLNVYGPSEYWCLFDHSSDSLAVRVFECAFSLFGILMVLSAMWMYFEVSCVLHQNLQEVNSQRVTRKVHAAAAKVIGYLIIMVFRWSVYPIYTVLYNVHFTHPALVIAVVGTLNSGGWLNACLYVHHLQVYGSRQRSKTRNSLVETERQGHTDNTSQSAGAKSTNHSDQWAMATNQIDGNTGTNQNDQWNQAALTPSLQQHQQRQRQQQQHQQQHQEQHQEQQQEQQQLSQHLAPPYKAYTHSDEVSLPDVLEGGLDDYTEPLLTRTSKSVATMDSDSIVDSAY